MDRRKGEAMEREGERVRKKKRKVCKLRAENFHF